MEAFARAPLPVVYPMHPRTKKRLRQSKLWQKRKSWKNIHILPPLGYFDFLVLMKASEMIITDSGGIQEEATAPPIRKPVLVTRLSTERPEAVRAGFAEVVGIEKKAIMKAIERTMRNWKELPEKSPYGSGDSAKRILEIVAKETVF
jgi:UDP-N-acetylglucosamine 2-epimerase (non-hydrolysing)